MYFFTQRTAASDVHLFWSEGNKAAPLSPCTSFSLLKQITNKISQMYLKLACYSVFQSNILLSAWLSVKPKFYILYNVLQVLAVKLHFLGTGSTPLTWML